MKISEIVLMVMASLLLASAFDYLGAHIDVLLDAVQNVQASTFYNYLVGR